MNTAEALFMAAQIWLGIGGVTSAAFLIFGIDRIDEDARGAYVFRPLLIPGVLLIWPLVLWRWARLETGRDVWVARYDPPRKSHGLVGVILPLSILLILLFGFAQRQSWPADIAPRQLTAPEATQ